MRWMRLDFLGSRKTAIIILTLIILACAAGSFIPQGQGQGQCLLSAKTCPLTRIFQLNDIYRSWWFIGILAFLGLSLLDCTLKRLKNWPGNAGSLFTHAGLIAILLGALITGAKGERGFISLYKGQSQDTFVLSRGAVTAPLLKKLPFKIYLHDFLVDWYEPQGEKGKRQIKEFRGRVAVIEDDSQVILTKEIRVNHPLKYKGYAFYQSGYNPKDPDWTGLEVSRDPGLPLVYAGFFLLNAGVIIIFYGRKK